MEPVSEGNVPSPLTPCLGTRNNPCAGMGQFSSPMLSFACPLRLPNRTSISKVPTAFSHLERRFEAKAPRPPGGRVFAKPRSCLATPPEVTVIVAEERRTRSCRLWGKGECACAGSQGPASESGGTLFQAPGRGWRTEYSGAAPSLAWLRIPGFGQ